MWQRLRHGHCVFFDDRRQNSIKWPRLLWNTGRQSSIMPSGYTQISFCSSCQLNAFPSHKRHFPWEGCTVPALWRHNAWPVPFEKDSNVFLSRRWEQDSCACKFIWACKSSGYMDKLKDWPNVEASASLPCSPLLSIILGLSANTQGNWRHQGLFFLLQEKH